MKPEQKQLLPIFAGAAGGGVAIGIMEAFSVSTAFPLVAIPFATSIVLVLGSPDAALRNRSANLVAMWFPLWLVGWSNR